MNASTRKLNRSRFLQSLGPVGPVNHRQQARLDCWGAIALVGVIGTLAKLAHSWLTN